MFASSRKSLLSCALLGAAVVGAMAMGTSKVDAQIILTPPVGVANGNPVITSLGGGDYSWTYSISLGADTSVATGDSFAIVDFGGFIGTPTLAGSLASGFTVSQTYAYLAGGLQDTNPAGYGYNDPTVADVVLTYSGTTISNTSGSAISPLGTLVLTTTASIPKSGWISSASEYYPSGDAEQFSATADVPDAPLAAGPLPLPAMLWPGLGTLAAIAISGAMKMRKRIV